MFTFLRLPGTTTRPGAGAAARLVVTALLFLSLAAPSHATGSDITSSTRSSISLSADLTDTLGLFVPSCATACVESFVRANFPASVCGTSPTFACLCAHVGTDGFTLGEAGAACLVFLDGRGRCTGRDALAAVTREVYSMCADVAGAAQPTHATIPVASVLQSTVFASTRTATETATPTTKTAQTTTSARGSLTAASIAASIAASTSTSTSTPTTTTSLGKAATVTPMSSSTLPASAASTGDESEEADAGQVPQRLTTAQILGISVGTTAVFLVIASIYFFLRRKRKQRLAFVGDGQTSDTVRRTPSCWLGAMSKADMSHELQISLPVHLQVPPPRQPLEYLAPLWQEKRSRASEIGEANQVAGVPSVRQAPRLVRQDQPTSFPAAPRPAEASSGRRPVKNNVKTPSSGMAYKTDVSSQPTLGDSRTAERPQGPYKALPPVRPPPSTDSIPIRRMLPIRSAVDWRPIPDQRPSDEAKPRPGLEPWPSPRPRPLSGLAPGQTPNYKPWTGQKASTRPSPFRETVIVPYGTYGNPSAPTQPPPQLQPQPTPAIRDSIVTEFAEDGEDDMLSRVTSANSQSQIQSRQRRDSCASNTNMARTSLFARLRRQQPMLPQPRAGQTRKAPRSRRSDFSLYDYYGDDYGDGKKSGGESGGDNDNISMRPTTAVALNLVSPRGRDVTSRQNSYRSAYREDGRRGPYSRGGRNYGEKNNDYAIDRDERPFMSPSMVPMPLDLASRHQVEAHLWPRQPLMRRDSRGGIDDAEGPSGGGIGVSRMAQMRLGGEMASNLTLGNGRPAQSVRANGRWRRIDGET